MKRIAIVLVTVGLHLGSQAQTQAVPTKAPLQTVPALDLNKYLGQWYEIAKYPNRFQQQCTGNTQAYYRLNDNGTVQVSNRCRLASGQIQEALGTAKSVGGSHSPKLKVRFAPDWLSFLPWVWGDYWVIDLDPDYRWVAVSEPTREHLWVLARQPRMDSHAYSALLQRLSAQGFDTEKLELTPQP